MLLNPQKKAIKQKGVGTYCLSFSEASRIAFDTDKTIAHTKGYVRSQHWLYKPMMWCYCYHLRVKSNFARISLMKIISITPFTKKSFLTTSVTRNCCKINKKVSNSIYKFAKKIESPLKMENDKIFNFCNWYSKDKNIRFCHFQNCKNSEEYFSYA